jgi:hypothetical protein
MYDSSSHTVCPLAFYAEIYARNETSDHCRDEGAFDSVVVMQLDAVEEEKTREAESLQHQVEQVRFVSVSRVCNTRYGVLSC